MQRESGAESSGSETRKQESSGSRFSVSAVPISSVIQPKRLTIIQTHDTGNKRRQSKAKVSQSLSANQSSSEWNWDYNHEFRSNICQLWLSSSNLRSERTSMWTWLRRKVSILTMLCFSQAKKYRSTTPTWPRLDQLSTHLRMFRSKNHRVLTFSLATR